MIRPLFWPMRLRTKHQTLDTTVLTRAGMPQGDPSSPILFNLFMDSYIQRINTKPQREVVSLFVDDVLMMAKSLPGMQKVLSESEAWALSVCMQWAVEKSFGVQIPGTMILARKTLQAKPHVEYHGPHSALAG